MYLLGLKYSQKKMAGKDPTNPLPHLSLNELILFVAFPDNSKVSLKSTKRLDKSFKNYVKSIVM